MPARSIGASGRTSRSPFLAQQTLTCLPWGNGFPDSYGGAFDGRAGVAGPAKMQPGANVREIADHGLALGAIGEQRLDSGYYVGSGKVVLQELRDHLAGGDQVGHRDIGNIHD